MSTSRPLTSIWRSSAASSQRRDWENTRVVGCGVADPGTVDLATGRAVRAVNVPGWKDIPILKEIRNATGLSSLLHRGDGWEALGGVAFGAGRGAKHALYVTLLEGIGGGIIVSDYGLLCGCGGSGCLEAHLAPARLAAFWRGMSAEQAQRVTLRCGDVLVQPGDLVFAGFDGVVVIPKSVEIRAIQLAAEKVGKENSTRRELLKGRTLRDVTTNSACYKPASFEFARWYSSEGKSKWNAC